MDGQPRPSVPLLDLDLLRTLTAIAETGSFSAAGQAVGRTPSAISMQVKKVEDLLGKTVFERGPRAVTLTVEGNFLVEHARQMLAMNRAAMERYLVPDVTGQVRIGAADEVAERFLPGMLRSFADSHPGVVVNVVIDDSKHLIAAMDEGRLDAAIVTMGNTSAARMNAEPLLQEQLVWGARRGSRTATERPLPVSVWEEGCAWREAAVVALRGAGIPWRVAFLCAHISGTRAAVLADLAVAPIPVSSLGGEIVDGGHAFGLPPLPPYAMGLIQAPELSAAAQTAVAYIRHAFRLARAAAQDASTTASSGSARSRLSPS